MEDQTSLLLNVTVNISSTSCEILALQRFLYTRFETLVLRQDVEDGTAAVNSLHPRICIAIRCSTILHPHAMMCRDVSWYDPHDMMCHGSQESLHPRALHDQIGSNTFLWGSGLSLSAVSMSP